MGNYTKEIQGLHQFFEDYLKGQSPPELMARFTEVLDPKFTLVASDGAIIDHDTIISYVRNGHGQRPNFRIWTENIVLRHHIGDIMLVTYEEWQTIDDTSTVRMSTAIFREDSSMPNSLIWLHVHESGLHEIVLDT